MNARVFKQLLNDDVAINMDNVTYVKNFAEDPLVRKDIQSIFNLTDDQIAGLVTVYYLGSDVPLIVRGKLTSQGIIG